MGSGTLNLDIGNILHVTGTANLGGYLNIANLGITLAGGSAELMSYSHDTGGFSNSASIAGYYLTDTGTQLDLIGSVPSGPATWSSTAGGSWTTPGNWSTGTSPSGKGVLAVMSTIPTTATTVTLDAAQTLGTLVFNNTAGYTITGGSVGNYTLTLDNTGGTGNASIVVLSGTHSIFAAHAGRHEHGHCAQRQWQSLDRRQHYRRHDKRDRCCFDPIEQRWHGPVKVERHKHLWQRDIREQWHVDLGRRVVALGRIELDDRHHREPRCRLPTTD